MGDGPERFVHGGDRLGQQLDYLFLRFWTIIYVKTIESIKKMGYNETKKQRNFSAPFSGG